MYCYLKFKLSYFKNLKLFSIRAKELSKPIVLWRKATGFSSFYKHFLEKPIFEWRYRWFCGKERKIGKGNLYLTENRLSWNVMCCASDNHNYMCHTCAKEFLYSSFNKKLLTKYQIFTILPQISHFHKFRNFSSIFATFETNCFIPINFMAGTCQEYSFSFLPVATR